MSIEKIVHPKGMSYKYGGKPHPVSDSVREADSSSSDEGEKIEIKLDFRKPFDQFFSKFGKEQAPSYLSSIPDRVKEVKNMEILGRSNRKSEDRENSENQYKRRMIPKSSPS